MRILIDTNILIHFEDNKIISESFYKFYRTALSNNCQILYHESLVKDIENDKNEERKKIILSKLQKYQRLENPAVPDQEFLSVVKQKKTNDVIDNLQLYQVYKDYVELFITEDKGILEKAKKLKIESKVKDIKNGLSFLFEEFRFKIPSHPILKEGSVREIISCINDPFFDSLRNDYKGFNKWLENCAKKDRRAYYLIVSEQISAILIYKKESPQEHQIPGIQFDALKMCTFKVSENTFGFKIGELFLSKMFSYCIEAKIKFLYLTIFPKHDRLINLLRQYGFNLERKNNSGEYYMLKDLNKPTNIDYSLRNSDWTHPFYFDDLNFKKYIVPIEEKYSTTLFKDSEIRDPHLFDKNSIQEIQGHTIKKAYICSSRVKVKENDILFFYISKTKKTIEPVGIVDSYHRVSDFDELLNLTTKRTVFSKDNLKEILDRKKVLTVILFRLIVYLKKPINYNELKKLNSCKNNLTTITNLSEHDYIILKNRSYFDERYIVN